MQYVSFVLSALLLLVPVLGAQEVKFIDATHDLYGPPPWSQQPPAKRNLRGINPIPKERATSVEQHGTLRTTVKSLDHYEHDLEDFDGRSIAFEIRVENVGTSSIRVPIGTGLASLQSHANQAAFGYWQMGIGLFVKALVTNSKERYWLDHPFADLQFFGSDSEPETMLTLEPHEWLTVRSNDWITLMHPKDTDQYLKFLSSIHGVTSRVGIASGWFDGDKGGLLFTNRITNVEGPEFPIRITDSRP